LPASRKFAIKAANNEHRTMILASYDNIAEGEIVPEPSCLGTIELL
jgi:hypothetical protein